MFDYLIFIEGNYLTCVNGGHIYSYPVSKVWSELSLLAYVVCKSSIYFSHTAYEISNNVVCATSKYSHTLIPTV